jgi:uncharacterized protein YbjT (DUF2867 family)
MTTSAHRQIVTVFGGSGFIGRHLTSRLAKAGWVVRVVCRDPEAANFMRTMGDVGQVIPWGGIICDQKSVATALDGASAAVNLVGILYESGAATFDAIHHQAAKTIAETAAAMGITNFVQMSALGASTKSEADYAVTKALGEAAVKAAIPTASIVRPSVVFGPEDNFFNQFAGICRLSPFLPVMGAPALPKISLGGQLGITVDLLGDGGPKFQPVFVGNVVGAIVKCLEDDDTDGQIYELAGPTVYSFAGLMRLVLKVTERKRILLPIPFWVAEMQAFVLEKLPKPLLTTDQIRLMQTDNVLSGDQKTLSDLGITPMAAEAILPTYLHRYRIPRAQAHATGS